MDEEAKLLVQVHVVAAEVDVLAAERAADDVARRRNLNLDLSVRERERERERWMRENQI